MSYQRLLKEVGLWPRQHGIPSLVEYRILCHLVADPNARVYLEDDSDYYAGVTNSNDTPGWTVKNASLFGLRHGCHENRRPWVKLDRSIKRGPGSRLRAYQITDAGFEAIAQHNARLKYEEEHIVLAKALLAECRKAAQDLKPK